MNRYNPNKHHRRSIRLKGYDYSQAGLYFITLCCQDRHCFFGEIKEDKMLLNAFGQIALAEWFNTSKVRHNVVLHECVIMPNHIHGILEITFKKGDQEVGKFQSPSQTVGSIVRGYKVATIKKIKDFIIAWEAKEDNKDELFKTNNPYRWNKFGDSSGSFSWSFSRDGWGDSDSWGFSWGELQFAPADLIELIRSYDYKIWQRNYYENIIKTEKAYLNISNYISTNPLRWEEDTLR
nr:transposase [uncultured Flavobacterium sp.]